MWKSSRSRFLLLLHPLVVCITLGGGASKRHFKESTISTRDRSDPSQANLDCQSPKGKGSLISQISGYHRFLCLKSMSRDPSIVSAVSWHLPDAHQYTFGLFETALISWNRHYCLNYLTFSCFIQIRTLLPSSYPIEAQRRIRWANMRWATA